MNRSLPIVLCNFMLVSMLAVTHFEKSAAPGEERARPATPIVDVAKGDIVDSLKASLKNEEATKAELAHMLDARAADLDRERTRTEALEQEKSRLQGEQERLERLRKQLEDERASLAGQVQMSQTERDKLRDDIAAAQAREKLIVEQLAQSQKDLKQAQADNAALQERVNVAERDKAVLAERLEGAQAVRLSLESEIATLRGDREAASAQAAKLAENVGQLAQAQKDSQNTIAQQIRQAAPLSINEIYDSFRHNRAALRFTARETVLIGDGEDACERYTVLVRRANGHVLALCESAGTPLRLSVLGGLHSITAEMIVQGQKSYPVARVGFMRVDPRIVAFPADGATAAGAPCVQLEDSPLRFSTAVVVTADGDRYGEAPIRIMPGTSRYIEVLTSMSNKLFSSFAPSEGDLVFSLRGNLIGFMVS